MRTCGRICTFEHGACFVFCSPGFAWADTQMHVMPGQVPHNLGGTIGVVLTCFFSIGFMFMVGGSVRNCVAKSDDNKEDPLLAALRASELWDRACPCEESACYTLFHHTCFQTWTSAHAGVCFLASVFWQSPLVRRTSASSCGNALQKRQRMARCASRWRTSASRLECTGG